MIRLLKTHPGVASVKVYKDPANPSEINYKVLLKNKQELVIWNDEGETKLISGIHVNGELKNLRIQHSGRVLKADEVIDYINNLLKE